MGHSAVMIIINKHSHGHQVGTCKFGKTEVILGCMVPCKFLIIKFIYNFLHPPLIAYTVRKINVFLLAI